MASRAFARIAPTARTVLRKGSKSAGSARQSGAQDTISGRGNRAFLRVVGSPPFLSILSLDRLILEMDPFRGELALQILALVLIAALLLLPAARMLRFLRRDKQQTDPILREAPRQMVEQIVVLALVVLFLAVAVMMHLGPF